MSKSAESSSYEPQKKKYNKKWIKKSNPSVSVIGWRWKTSSFFPWGRPTTPRPYRPPKSKEEIAYESSVEYKVKWIQSDLDRALRQEIDYCQKKIEYYTREIPRIGRLISTLKKSELKKCRPVYENMIKTYKWLLDYHKSQLALIELKMKQTKDL